MRFCTKKLFALNSYPWLIMVYGKYAQPKGINFTYIRMVTCDLINTHGYGDLSS